MLKKLLKRLPSLVPVHKTNPLTKLYAGLAPKTLPFKNQPKIIECAGSAAALPPFLIGTTNGAFLIEGGKALKILPHYVYGITAIDRDRWVMAQTHRYFDYARLVLVDLKAGSAKIIAPHLGKRAHQIDMIGDTIYVTDTYRNAIERYSLDGKRISTHHPFGELGKDGRAAENYKHINSVYGDESGITIFCHNETKKTDNFSEIAILDQDMNIQKAWPVSAMNGHNVLPLSQGYLYCDSLGKNTLNLDNQILFTSTGYLTRGLAVNDQTILLGASLIAERKQRDKGHSLIHVLNSDFEETGRIKMPDTGNIHEIRFLESDIGLSHNADKKGNLELKVKTPENKHDVI